jgi:type IV pilus assembly protein PilY1
MKVFNKKILSSQVSMLMTLTICLGLPQSYASDVEIYSSGGGGTVTLMLAIDTSRSMEEADDHDLALKDFGIALNSNVCRFGDYSNKRNSDGSWFVSNQSLLSETVTRGGVSYTRKYCRLRANSTGNEKTYYTNNIDNSQCVKDTVNNQLKCYDRLSLVKDGLFDLLLGSADGAVKPVSDDKVIGLSHFSLINRQNDGVVTGNGNKRGAVISVPAKPLNDVVEGVSHRTLLLRGIAGLEIDGAGGTPSAALLAETAIYLMGRSPFKTSGIGAFYAQESFRKQRSNDQWQKCTAWNAEVNNLKKCLTWTNVLASDLPKTTRDGKDHYYEFIYRPVSADDGYDYYTSNLSDHGTGFFNSVLSSRINNRYLQPTSISSQTSANSQCNGQGIYFLTDGEPNESNPKPQDITRLALNNTGLTCGDTNTCFTEMVKKLFSKENPSGLSIRTAVVGFGKDINRVKSYDDKPLVAGMQKADGSVVSDDEATLNVSTNLSTINSSPSSVSSGAKDTAKWGIYGRGGWYSGNNAEDVVNSVNKFLTSIERTIPSVTTGSPSIPIDALNPIGLQPFGYYTTFSPKPADSVSLWVGNLNKYKVLNGQLYGSSSPLFKADGSVDETVSGLWASGVVGQLKLKHTGVTSSYTTQRKLYTNRTLILDTTARTYKGVSSNVLATIDLASLLDTAKFGNDPRKNYWLNLLGFQVSTTGSLTLEDIIAAPELRQIGAVMHSTPLLLTQEGKITATNGVVATTDREDYLLFGTTQGLLHVVDKDGKEVFAFVPNEMMENQTTAMANAGSTGGSVNTLFYGIDAPWTAYTQYVSKTVNGSTIMTVKDSGRLSNEDNDKSATLKGEQWVYGGLRMGGKSYYALDLTDINNPELKFHIDPENAAATNPIKFMGQSWSKPTIGFVNWEGERKRVMFVGGGYDPNYENRLYEPSNNTIDHGAGVYMFSASGHDAGSLLWWSSANTNPSADIDGPKFTQNTDLKYSVPSQINTLDRDGDGLIDNLYFGDLGGQVFRVDLNNNDSINFGHRVTLMYSAHTNDGRSPRFYEMPSISIHADDKGAYGIAALSSGNRSSPLAGSQSGILNDSAQDGVFVIFDHDLGKSDLYKSTFTATSTEALSVLNPLIGVERHKIVKDTPTKKDVIKYYRGWRHNFVADAVSGAYKGTNEIYALDNMLYVNVYERDGTGIGGKCGAGVKGDSHLFQYCLPTGKCNFYTDTSNVPYRVKLGAGILGAGVGLGYDNDNKKLGLVIAKSRDSSFCAEPANKHKPECQLFNTKIGLQQLRWYED